MWRVLLLNTKDCSPNLSIVRSVEDALRLHPDVGGVWNVEYADALHTAIHQQCNLLLAIDGVWLDRGLCRRLRHVCRQTALWIFEDPYNRLANLQNADLFDRVFTNDLASLPHYGAKGVHLPLAANPRFHEHAIPDDADEARHYLYDLFFVGAPWPNRVQLLQKLTAAVGDLRCKFGLGDIDFRKLAIGHDRPAVANPLNLPESAYAWRAANREMARLANRSRVVLMLHREFSAGGGDLAASTPGPRLFEAALAGGFQLADLTLGELANYYLLDEEIVGFRNADECVELLRRYLQAPSQRLQIARAAQERTRREHLYSHRIATILEAMRGQKPAESAAPLPSAASRSKRVLYVYHNHITAKTFGGVEVYVDELSRSLPDRYEPFLYFPDRNRDSHAAAVTLIDVRRNKRVEHRFDGPLGLSVLREPQREAWFARLLHEHRIDLVHFQHLLGHPWSLPLVARSLGLPTLFTMMDFFPVCTHLNLLRHGQYCNAASLPAAACDICLSQQNGLRRFSQASRRSYIGRVLSSIDTLIPLSQSTCDILLKTYPQLGSKTEVIVEGLPLRSPHSLGDAPQGSRPASGDNRLRVAIPGSFYPAKGADTACQVFSAMRHEPIEFHIFGHIDPAYERHLAQLKLPNVISHGKYAPDRACQQLAQFDLALLLSIWPETYVLALSEVWAAGVVPIVTDIGALGERVAHQRNGFKVPVNEPGAIVALLRQLSVERSQIDEVRRQIHSGLYRSLSDHLQVLSEIYDRLADKYRVDARDRDYFTDPAQVSLAGGANTFLGKHEWTTAPAEAEHADSVPPIRLAGQPRSNWRRFSDHVRTHGMRRTIVRSIQEILK